MEVLNLLNGVSPVMGEFSMFHDKAIMVMVLMACLVGGLIILMVSSKYKTNSFLDHKGVEFLWTVLPSLVLFTLALPSLKLLYYLDISKKMGSGFSLKSVGHQWYWTNSFNFNGNVIESDMYMVKTPDLLLGDFRNLETDSVLVAPVFEVVRLVVGADDVIHSFAIPSLGLKIDAVPGRLNQQFFFSDLVGVFYGQCSEICGANHSFMPITLEIYSY